MEADKGKSIVGALQQPHQAPASCRRRLTFDGEPSNRKRKSIPSDVYAAKLVKKSKSRGRKTMNKEGGSSDKEGGKNETSIVLVPPTPLPLREKKTSRKKGSIAVGTNKLQIIEKFVSESEYYTRYMNKLVSDEFELLESEKKTYQPRSPRKANKVIGEWRKLLRMCDDGNQPQSLCTRGLSFVNKVGSILGSKVSHPWKGSVLDSIIGVFLAQRVSDNLSSSAFMSLGASFPKIQDASRYGPSHKMLGEKIPNAQSSKKTCFDVVSKCSEFLGDGAALEKLAQFAFDEKRRATPQKGKVMRKTKLIHEWSSLRKKYAREEESERSIDALDYGDWDALSRADVVCISESISSRGMNVKLAKRIKGFLTRLLAAQGNLNLEWLSNVPPEETMKFILSIEGLGVKSEECMRLLTLRQRAFPVDINVARVTVRLGWVPAPPVEDEHLMRPLQDSSAVHDLIYKYLWPLLCELDPDTLYQLHYQMITFGKVFCTNEEPRCEECPMRTECKYYSNTMERKKSAQSDKESTSLCMDIEDFGSVDKHGKEKTLAQELTLARLRLRSQRKQCLVKDTKVLYLTNSVEPPQTPEKSQSVLSLRLPKISEKKLASKKRRVPKRSGSRTQHVVYELSDCHRILETFAGGNPDDSNPYLLVIWESEALSAGFIEQSTTVSGTIMIPCRTALRGHFPLNGTFFQKNEVFADHKTSGTPVDVHFKTLDQLPRKNLYCGSSLSDIVKGLSVDEITRLFSEDYFCTRGFDCETFTPKPLEGRLHLSSEEKRKQKQQQLRA